jgi:PEP-CTERM motif
MDATSIYSPKKCREFSCNISSDILKPIMPNRRHRFPLAPILAAAAALAAWAASGIWEYNGSDVWTIERVPEASTWLAAAFALGAIGFTQRRRLVRMLRAGRQLSKVGLVVAMISGSAAVAHAQLSLTGFTTETIDFDTTVAGVENGAFTGAGFQSSPTSGQLDSDAWAMTGWSDGNLAFGGTITTGDYARGTASGGVTTGGVYGFDVDPTAAVDSALGFQPGGTDWNPGTVTLQIVNNTGITLDSLSLSYDVYIYNDQERSNSFNFSYSSDDSTYSPVSALDLASAEASDASPAWVANARSTTITGLNIADGASFYLRWSGADISGSGSRDQFGLDNIEITAGAPVPEPSTWFAAALALAVVGYQFSVIVERRRRRQRRI